MMYLANRRRRLLDVVFGMLFCAFLCGAGCALLDSQDRTLVTIREAVIERAREELTDVLLPIFGHLVDSATSAPEADRALVLNALRMLARLEGITLLPEDYDTGALVLYVGVGGGGGAEQPMIEDDAQRDRHRQLIQMAIDAAELVLDNP